MVFYLPLLKTGNIQTDMDVSRLACRKLNKHELNDWSVPYQFMYRTTKAAEFDTVNQENC
jgi:hypothetical protein